ncbi:hypothetical protein JTE90_019871 [Oedothorax gibbosus]|uniref:Uncharacterized protein n=1 Tax=Oedothorax gibbosus TaxID=931172 RepID=A0AAV6VXB3_9ARAC|nr:hypothetical protein JTE90_019871 [Oedothorax gibbosus]
MDWTDTTTGQNHTKTSNSRPYPFEQDLASTNLVYNIHSLRWDLVKFIWIGSSDTRPDKFNGDLELPKSRKVNLSRCPSEPV